jgi:hypothetical protein
VTFASYFFILAARQLAARSQSCLEQFTVTTAVADEQPKGAPTRLVAARHDTLVGMIETIIHGTSSAIRATRSHGPTLLDIGSAAGRDCMGDYG